MLVDEKTKQSFLRLVRLGIGHHSDALPQSIDWNELETLAAEQGLPAIVVDGIEQLPDEQRPPKLVLLQWIGETLQGYEYRYEQYRKSIAEMAAFYNEHGFKMMVLKGYACGLDWPKPEHRPCGDIDIWLFGQQKEADAALAAWFKSSRSSKVQGGQEYEIDKSHHHHTIFYWRDFMVENHYDFINVHHHKSHAEIEKELKVLGQDDSHTVEVYGVKVYLPSPNLHALFLIKHMLLHFASEAITIRQILDWGFFVEKHTKEIDWEWLEGLLGKNGMMRIYNVLNAICVEDLGFEVGIFHQVQFEPFLKERVLNEIFSPEYSINLPKGIIRRAIYRYLRWRGNVWKHELCYKDSMWSAFWTGLWNHILKPSSI